jgi:antitoxin CptB
MDSVQANRLKWKCRRGLLELDIVLQRFLPHLGDEEADPLNQILELPDNDLWDIVIGRSDEYAPHLNEIVARLRAA